MNEWMNEWTKYLHSAHNTKSHGALHTLYNETGRQCIQGASGCRFQSISGLAVSRRAHDIWSERPDHNTEYSMPYSFRHNAKNQSELEANICKWRQARENARREVKIGFDFTSDWLRKWREIYQPIIERN